jgi:endonuclease YncB( thermonuclease family)
VLDVIDGDTIVVLQAGRQRVVSYMGIEAPRFGEGGQPNEVWASEALAANRALVQGKVVRIEDSQGRVNAQGEQLGYVWRDDELVNASLVRLGYARCSPMLVGSPHLDALAQFERQAREAQTGIWHQAQAQAMAPLDMQAELLLSPVPVSKLAEPEHTASGVSAEGTLDLEPTSSGMAAPQAPTPMVLALDAATAVPTATPPPTAIIQPTPPTPPTWTPTALPLPTETPLPTMPPPTPPPPPTAPPQAPAGSVQIASVFADGEKGRAEPDEYCEIKNAGASEINLEGWRLNAGAKGQDFVFPGVRLAPGQSCRVYTNEHHAESGGFSYESGVALWKNGGDCGYLYDASGQQVHVYCY